MRTDNEAGATNTVLDYIGLGQAVGVETLTSTPMPTDTAYALSPSGERIGLTKFASTGNMPEQLFDITFESDRTVSRRVSHEHMFARPDCELPPFAFGKVVEKGEHLL